MRTVKQKSVLFFKDCRKTPSRYIYIFQHFGKRNSDEKLFSRDIEPTLKYWNDFNSKLYELFI